MLCVLCPLETLGECLRGHMLRIEQPPHGREMYSEGNLSVAWPSALAGMRTVHSEGMTELCDFVRGRSPRLRGYSKPLCGQWGDI